MSKQVWMCEKCGRLVATESEAKDCEATHKEITTAKALSWCQGFYERPFPKTIKVTVAVKEGYDYALYDLRQIGPTPV